MEFDKSKVYTALNADEVKVGSKGYFADSLRELKDAVEQEDNAAYREIAEIKAADMQNRFSYKQFDFKGGECYNLDFNLFYLVEESKEEKYRPYKDTDEMIEDFKKRYNSYGGWSGKDNPMYNPQMWIKSKENKKYLIMCFEEKKVTMNFATFIHTINLSTLLDDYTYLDGSPCGIKE